MADKILGSIIHIKPVDKAASFEKILAHLNKSDDGKGSWLPESTDKVFNTRICENVIVEDGQDIYLGKTLGPSVIQSETGIISKNQETPGYPFNQPQTPQRPLKLVANDLNFLPEHFLEGNRHISRLQQIRQRNIRGT